MGKFSAEMFSSWSPDEEARGSDSNHDAEESSLESREAMEINRELLADGYQQESEKAKAKIEQGLEEHGGRMTFVAARSAELGALPEVSDDDWQIMKEGFEFKKSKKDYWGVSFAARYLRSIRADSYDREVEIDNETAAGFTQELQKRRQAAQEEPRRWGEFIAMADNVKQVVGQPNMVRTRWIRYPGISKEKFLRRIGYYRPRLMANRPEGIELDSEAIAGLKSYLLQENNPGQFVHVANSAENLKSGVLETAGISQGLIIEKLKAAILEAKKQEEQKDAWSYAFSVSQINGLLAKLK